MDGDEAVAATKPARSRRLFAAGLFALAFLWVSACTEGRPRGDDSAPPVVSPPESVPAIVEPPPAAAAEPPPPAPPAESPVEPPPAEPPPPEETEPELPAFSGRLIVSYGGRLYELTPGPVGQAERRPIGRFCQNCGEDVAAVSPDGSALVYSTAQQTRLLDLGTGETQPVLPHRSACLRFAPDGSRFAYVTEHLYVADRAGVSERVYEAPSATYFFFAEVGSEGVPRTMFGTVDCAVWLGVDRLVFDRFSGSMPRSLGEDTDEFGRKYFDELEPNGTSLVTLDPGPRLEHAAERLGVSATCGGGRYVLLRNDALLASGRRGLAGLEPRRLLRRRGVLASGFLPGSCTPYVVTVDGFKIVDPRQGKVEKTFDVDAGESGPDSGRRWQGIWVGDPTALVAAVVDFGSAGFEVIPGLDLGPFSEGCPCSVALLSVETGRVQVLARFPESAGQTGIPRVLAWLPA